MFNIFLLNKQYVEANSLIPSASLFLGIIPALILLYITIGRYEGHAKQKNIFLSFIVGIIIGFVAAVIELVTKNGAGLIVIVLYPLIEQLFKTVILNVRRLQEKQATVVYGLVLGLGFGAISTPVSIIMATIPGDNVALFGLVLIGSFGIIMLQGATGVMIGYGVYTMKLSRYILFAVLVEIPVIAGINIPGVPQIGVVLFVFVYGAFLYWYATRRIMTRLLSESQRRKRTKKEIKIKTK